MDIEDAKINFVKNISKVNSCWFWNKALDTAGYGIAWFNGKWIRAHRLSYILFNGSIPDVKAVLHSCDNRNCVNPQHLFLGTNKENSQDMMNKNRQARGEQCGNSKLKEKEVIEIRNSTLSSRILSKIYNISKTNIKDIKNNKIWRHINAQ